MKTEYPITNKHRYRQTQGAVYIMVFKTTIEGMEAHVRPDTNHKIIDQTQILQHTCLNVCLIVLSEPHIAFLRLLLIVSAQALTVHVWGKS